MKRRWFEYGLIVVGFLFVGLFAHSYLRYRSFQTQPFAPQTKPTVHSLVSSGQPQVNPHPAIGRVSIRRLGFSVLMVEGDDEESLELAAGHMPGTPLAGRPGNMVIAGHRDSVFWPLRNIRKGDRIEVQAEERAVYLVQDTQIVEPDDTRALADSKDAVLTLVTCYPFRHVGPAPKRFVVRARLASPR